MKSREIFVLIVIIAVGVTLTHIHFEKWDWGIELGDWFFDYEVFSFEETQELIPPFPEELQIINSHGTVKIEGSDRNTISIHLEKEIRRRDEDKAREDAESIQMIVDSDSDRLIVSSNRKDLRTRNLRTHFTLKIPEGTDIRVKNSFGLIEVHKVGNADLSNSNGEVAADHIAGRLIIDNSYEDVDVDQVESDCQISSRQSDLRVFNIAGKTLISHRYGKVRLEDIDNDVTIDGHDTDVFVRRVSGAVEVESSYESISLIDVGPAVIKGNGSPIVVDCARGSVEINNRYAKIQLDNIQGNLHVTGKDSRVSARDLAGDENYIETNYQDVEIIRFSGKMTIALDNGNVLLVPLPLRSSIDVRGTYCGINLFWPSGNRYPLEAQTKGGEIRWMLAAQPSTQVNNGHAIVKAFLDATQNPTIKLATTYGDILIEDASQFKEEIK